MAVCGLYKDFLGIHWVYSTELQEWPGWGGGRNDACNMTILSLMT